MKPRWTRKRTVCPTPREGAAVEVPPEGFACVVADVPWTHRTWSAKGGRRRHYRTMTTEQICAMRVGQRFAARDSFLLFWTTGPHLPDALRIIRAWGYRYSGLGFVWIKTNPLAPTLFYDKRSFHIGMGHTTRKNAELCLLASRGKPQRLSKSVHELIIAPRREHSRKPDQFYDRVETFCAGPRLDLFGRESRTGWVTWGDEAKKFDKKGFSA